MMMNSFHALCQRNQDKKQVVIQVWVDLDNKIVNVMAWGIENMHMQWVFAPQLKLRLGDCDRKETS